MNAEILKYLFDIKDAASPDTAPYRTSSPRFARDTNPRHCLLNRQLDQNAHRIDGIEDASPVQFGKCPTV